MRFSISVTELLLVTVHLEVENRDNGERADRVDAAEGPVEREDANDLPDRREHEDGDGEDQRRRTHSLDDRPAPFVSRLAQGRDHRHDRRDRPRNDGQGHRKNRDGGTHTHIHDTFLSLPHTRKCTPAKLFDLFSLSRPIGKTIVA